MQFAEALTIEHASLPNHDVGHAAIQDQEGRPGAFLPESGIAGVGGGATQQAGTSNYREAPLRREEFMELLEPQLNPLKHFVAGALRDSAEAEDVVQQTVLNAFRHIHQFRFQAQFKTWLRSIAINEIRQNRRRWLTRPVQNLEGAALDNLEGPDREDSPAGILERKESVLLVRRAVDRLPEKYRVVVELRGLKGLSEAETAQELRLSIPTVKIRLHRGRRLLSRALARLSVFGSKISPERRLPHRMATLRSY